MMRPMFNHAFLIVLLTFFATDIFAVGFEQAKLHSHLGEPLNIHIPLVLADGEKLAQSNVALASPHEYKILEQLLPQSYYSLRLDVEKPESASPVAVVSSTYAIDETILVIVLKVQRGRGIFYKKVQFFLDALPNVPVKKEKTWINTADSKVSFSEPNMKNMPNIQSKMSLNSGWARRDSYGPVQYGDSLSEIAYRLRRDKRWSNHQIMLALFAKNPEAFNQKNINQLKKGSFLRVPSGEEVKGFLASEQASQLKGMLASPAKRTAKKRVTPSENKDKNKKIEATQQKSVFHGRISLGLNETAENPIADALMLKRLEKLEPLYAQAMATDLRMDGLGGKLDSLAAEVSQLHQKIDALTALGFDEIGAQTKGAMVGESKSETNYGWIGFIILLVLNVLLFAGYFYRKQMMMWQNKLLEAQKKSAQQQVFSTPASQVETETYAKPDLQFYSQFEEYIPSKQHDSSKIENSEEKESIQAQDKAIGRDDLAIDNHDENINGVTKQPTRSILKEEQVKPISDALGFEEMIHKKEWQRAEEYYANMSREDCERPRTQALLVQKLHGEGDIVGRNLTLLNLFQVYENSEWNRLCSFFDEEIWQVLQDQKIISFTGKVVEEEVEKMNKQLLNQVAGISEDELDLSQTDISGLSMEDFMVMKNEVDATDTPTSQATASISQREDDVLDETVIFNIPQYLKDEYEQSAESEHEGEASDSTEDTLEPSFELDFSVLENEEDEEQKEQADVEVQGQNSFGLELDIPSVSEEEKPNSNEPQS